MRGPTADAPAVLCLRCSCCSAHGMSRWLWVEQAAGQCPLTELPPALLFLRALWVSRGHMHSQTYLNWPPLGGPRQLVMSGGGALQRD